MARGRSFPVYLSKKGGLSVDEGVTYDMGKLLCALTMHHGDRVMNDSYDDEELPIDYIFRDKARLNGPEFYACIKKIFNRVTPEYTLLGIAVEGADKHTIESDGVIIALSISELEDRLVFLLEG